MQAVVSLSILALAAAKEWSMSSLTQVTSIGGVFATNGNTVYGAVTDNNQGPGFESSSYYGKTGNFYGNVGLINTNIAFDESGNGAMTAFGNVYNVKANGDFSQDQNVFGFGQCVECVANGTFAAVGNYINKQQNANGVALTKDSGDTWELFDIADAYPVRYGAFPTETTWYITSGDWPSESMKKGEYRFSDKIKVKQDSKGKLQYHFNYEKKDLANIGYHGMISKTTDGGKTWSTVLDIKNKGYFNQINCFDESTCMAVGEGNEQTFTYLTQNGGKSWDIVHTTTDNSSMMGCQMLSATEAWTSGGNFDYDAKNLVGYYWHTTDAGKTWELSTLAKAVSLDLTFSEGVGYAAAVDETSSNIAVYN